MIILIAGSFSQKKEAKKESKENTFMGRGL
jgi:hypothetical protein